jgi:hypothetical protein
MLTDINDDPIAVLDPNMGSRPQFRHERSGLTGLIAVLLKDEFAFVKRRHGPSITDFARSAQPLGGHRLNQQRP